MNKVILTDVDGVLACWENAFEEFMIAKGFPRVPNTDTEYSMALRHNITIRQAQAYIEEFNESDKIANLDPFADSVEYISKLANHGFRFIAVTSISDQPLAKTNRIKNLKNLFGDVFDDVVCLATSASKAHVLMQWADTGYFWIEDHQRQAEAGHEAGLKTILINHPYNIHYTTDLFPKVSYETPWKEIYEIISKEYRV